MEQKKTLWIIAAVGVFLLVVLGGACIVYTPAKKSTQVVAKQEPAKTEIQRPDFNDSGLNKVNEMFVVSENTTVYDLNKSGNSSENTNASAPTSTTIDLNAFKREITETVSSSQPQSQNINITVTIPEKESAPIIVTPDYGKAQQTTVSSTPAAKTTEKKETTTVATKPATTKPAAKPAETSPKPATTTTAKPATTTAKPAATPAKTITRYWVQVSAYTNKKTAENARSVLTENKITSDIFTYTDAKNRLFYRVRVGPYTTKSEAEYWQAKILKIDDFKNSQSYVTSTTD